MYKNPVEELIRKEGADDSAIFVFPSDIAASLWLNEALSITGRETLPSSRFIAWDRFKEHAVQSTVAGKKPVTAVLRKLYALELAERNSISGAPLFRSLIPVKFAQDGAIFANWIARLLSQLAVWEITSNRSTSYTKDDEDNDLSLLKADYGQFLETNLLFEPSWQRPPLKNTGNRYFIFFPEAIDDFSEYASIFMSAPFITPVYVPADTALTEIHFYENTREELRAVALTIESLLRSGTKPEEIAVSVPDLETVSPYLLRELSLRGIPIEYRAGESLGSRAAGRLFSLIQNCVSSQFSFASLKALLLDRLIPWKDRKNAEALIYFGIRNHCVTSWKDEGKLIDIWEEAFKTPTKGESGDWDLRSWYRDLKKALSRMVSSENFTSIRNNYFIFREAFLDSSLYAPEDDAVVARCIEELNILASLENHYPLYIPKQAYSFFISVLNDKNYVAQRQLGGVSIFPYRVAAGTPFPHHFILDATQDQATVLNLQLPFLRQDKRVALNILENDASDAFFIIYNCCARQTSTGTCGAHFSFAARSFSGYRTPHGFFRTQIHGETNIGDPFTEEREWLATQSVQGDENAKPAFPARLYPSQKNGHDNWKKHNAERSFSYLDTPFSGQIPQLSELIIKRQMNGEDIRVSQTDLGIFSICNARWFLSKVLRIEAPASDAELMNERNLGLLYHDVLKKVYEKIRAVDTTFQAAHLGDYRSWSLSFAEEGAADHAEFKGPLAAPLISSLIGKIAEGVGGILQSDAELLDGFIPDFLEDDIAFSSGGINYYGRIDRISRRPGDNVTILIDYKSGKIPTPADYKTTDNQRIKDFQIPMYVFLAEESPNSPYKGSLIEHAWIGNIKEAEYRPIINDNETIVCGSKKGMIPREEFENAMKSFKEMTNYFVSSIQAQDFTRPENLAWQECTTCDFQKICRTTYAVRP